MTRAAVTRDAHSSIDNSWTAVGPPAAPAIVFIHGTRLTRAFWSAQVEALRSEFRVITLDLPGHGTRSADAFTLERAADGIAAAIRQDGHSSGGGRVAPVVVVGLSLGGYVAMVLAAREPELVRGLVLAGATAEPVGIRAVAFKALAAALERFDAPPLNRVNAWFFRTRYPGAIAEPIIAGGFWSRGGAAAVRTIVGQRFAPRLATYPGSTLIINGEWDLPFRWSSGTFAAVARDARRVRLAGALHLSNLDRPAAFTEAVRQFARSVRGT